MFEGAVAQRLLDLALERLPGDGAAVLRAVHARVSTAESLDPGAVDLQFRLAARGTPAAGARLSLTVEPASLDCLRCGLRFAARAAEPGCPGCGFAGATLAEEARVSLEEVELQWLGI